MKNLAYLFALHSVDGLGPIRLTKILNHFSDPKLAWDASLSELKEIGLPKNALDALLEKRKTLDPENYLEEILSSGIKILTIFDEDYPKSLKDIYDPPIILFYKGEILPQDAKAIGVVGTRKVTGYGKLATENLVDKLVSSEFTIVSGLARGVDTVAHTQALKSGGRTLAVLGGGINSIFPPDNTSLAQKIISQGAVLSEYHPDSPHLPGNFPARNRIIAGLSQGVLVTEAASDSGSLITARLALEQGREVFAVPGPITSTVSEGTADLIKDGARVVTRIEDILEELGVEVKSVKEKVNNGQLSEIENKILNCLENETMHIDEICRQLNKPASEVSSSLIKMEIQGFVKNLGGGNYTH